MQTLDMAASCAMSTYDCFTSASTSGMELDKFIEVKAAE
jgi:hypothetical protein